MSDLVECGIAQSMTEKETDAQITDITIGFVQCGTEKPSLRLTVFGAVAVIGLTDLQISCRDPALQIVNGGAGRNPRGGHGGRQHEEKWVTSCLFCLQTPHPQLLESALFGRTKANTIAICLVER